MMIKENVDVADNVMPQTISAREWTVLCLVLVLTFAYRFHFIQFFDVMSADGTGYAISGRQFFKTWKLAEFGTVQPPLYPLLVGFFHLFIPDLETSARTVSVAFSTLTIIPLYLLGRAVYGKAAAWCATVLFISLPFIHQMSAIDITEPTYTAFAFAGAYAFWRAYSSQRKWTFGLGGILIGAAYLARPEGFIFGFALCVLVITWEMYSRGVAIAARRMAAPVALFAAGFLLVASPYLSYLHSSTGKWQLSGKTALNSKIILEYGGAAPADQHLQVSKEGNLIGGGDTTLMDLLKKEPELFWGNIRANIEAFPGMFSSAFPPYFWPLVMVGCAGWPRRKDKVALWLTLVSMCAPLALYILYFIQPRGFYAYLPVLLIFVGGGFSKTEAWIERISPKPVRMMPIAYTVLACLCAYYLYSERPLPKPPYHYEQDGGRFDEKQIGIRLRSVLPEKAIIMTRSGRIGFYSQHDFVLPPQGDLAQIIEYAKKNRAEYLIATLQLLIVRPQLEMLYGPILTPMGGAPPPPELQLVYQGQEPGGVPYLVYRIK